MAVLVTGAAGFIGYHVCEALLFRDEQVVGVDDLNDYYDPSLKRARLDGLAGRNGFSFHKLDIADREALFAVCDGESGLDRIIHLAAQAGVRHSFEDPYVYVEANVMGQLVVLEACRRLPEYQAPGLRKFVLGLRRQRNCPSPSRTGSIDPFHSTPRPSGRAS